MTFNCILSKIRELACYQDSIGLHDMAIRPKLRRLPCASLVIVLLALEDMEIRNLPVFILSSFSKSSYTCALQPLAASFHFVLQVRH